MNQSYDNSKLVFANNLIRGPSGILLKDEYENFGYSDGEDSELFLTDTLQDAVDLSSTSEELASKIRDWPSEYHLSAKRANLLRGLNLGKGLRVLELGCGCGAVSRYLGEQGFHVDAIEGSRTRAEIAALRCRDLSNVNIVCSNFNELVIPENAYDMVLLVGVVEYAARFWPETIRHEDAVVKLLSTVRGRLRPGGILLVAIENRTGMKYVLGAHEDHCSKRYIGIHGYHDCDGIKTYTRGEWANLIDRSGFPASGYLFPFPDYKVPTVILSEEYSLTNKKAFAHIEGVKSRDYQMNLDLREHEPVFWEAASANRTIPQFSNSFLILMGESKTDLATLAPYDFVHLPDFKRKNQYSMIIRKRSDSDMVERESIDACNVTNESMLVQHVRNESFLEGDLLSILWSRCLLVDPFGGQRFKKYLTDYYEYLGNSVLYIDLVPNNIIATPDGEYRHFDQEWDVDWELTRDYVFFRSLLLFALRHEPVLREFARWQHLHTIKHFVLHGFRLLTPGTRDLSEYVEIEERFQHLVNKDKVAGSVIQLLESRINQPKVPSTVSAKLYWKQPGRSYSEERFVAIEVSAEDRGACLSFELPPDVENISHLRFDPCDESRNDDVGFLEISLFRVDALRDGQRKVLLVERGNERIAMRANLRGIVFNKEKYGEIFAVVGDNPELEFVLDTTSDRTNSGYRIEVECTHTRSPEYLLTRDRFLVQEEILKKEIEYRDEVNRQIQVQLEEKNVQLQEELELIKASRMWKIAEIYRSIRKTFGG